ncbi:MAG: PPC domain-containing protein [Verrucomicrobiota bacterium]
MTGCRRLSFRGRGFAILGLACLALYSVGANALAQDAFDSGGNNDSTADATDFGATVEIIQPNLSIHASSDEDFFKITPPGDYTVHVEILFSHGNGDLDLQVLDAGSGLIKQSTSTDDNESLTFLASASTSYFIRVFGFGGATNSNYTLNIRPSTIVTNNGGGTGEGALHNAIIGANFLSAARASNVDITFDAAVTGTISLTQSLPDIDEEVSILGPGRDDLAVSGALSFRVFNIDAGAECAISGLTLRDGRTAGQGERGGGIHSEGDLVITQCLLTENEAGQGSAAPVEAGGGDGGAIFTTGFLTMEDCELRSNRAGDGFPGNGPSTDGGWGGAVYCDFQNLTATGQITFRRCLFVANEAGDGADGRDESFPLNAGFGGFGGNGGALYLDPGPMRDVLVEDCVFDGNRSGHGGRGGADSLISVAVAGGFGGNGAALMSVEHQQLIVRRSVFQNNRTGDGGDVDSDPSDSPEIAGNGAVFLRTDNCTLFNCTFHGNEAGIPGERDLEGPSVEASASALAWVATPSPPKLVHCTFTENSATGLGGPDMGAAIRYDNNNAFNPTPICLENTIVFGNTVTNGGTSIPANTSGHIILAGANLIGNHAGTTTGTGTMSTSDPLLGALQDNGGLTETRLPLPGSPALDGAPFGTPNAPATDQRGVSRPYGNAPDIGAVESTQLIVNTPADENDGINFGGISLRDALAGHQVILGAFENGIGFEPAVFGVPNPPVIELANGPIDINGLLPVIVDSIPVLRDNGDPGVVIDGLENTRIMEIDSGSDVTLQGLKFTRGLSAPGNDGGGIFNEGILTMEVCHVTECGTARGDDGADGTSIAPEGLAGEDSGSGGGIFNSSPVFSLENSIVAGNIDEFGAPLDVSGDFMAVGQNIINLIPATTTVSGNSSGIINVDPLLAPLDFYGGPTETRHPYPNSPAISGSANLGSPPILDQRGYPRNVGLTVDLGAVETYVGGGLIDNDLDGMDDRWESIFKLNTTIDDSGEDKDGDGQNNRDEFGHFTNPCDPNSKLKITLFDYNANVFPPTATATWTSWPDREYTMEVGPDLKIWVDEPSIIQIFGDATSMETTRQFPLQLPDRFSRVFRN